MFLQTLRPTNSLLSQVGRTALLTVMLTATHAALLAQEPCVFADELVFCPLGQADVSESAGGVKVSNLSLSGRDGTSLDLTGVPEMVVDVRHQLNLGEIGLVGDGYVQFATRGPIERTEGVIIRSTLWASGGSLYATTDFPDLPAAENFIAAVADDRIVAFHGRLEDGYTVRFTPLSGGSSGVMLPGDVRRLSDGGTLHGLPAPVEFPISNLQLITICPMGAGPGFLWDICERINCENDDITLIDPGDPYRIDIINPQLEIVDSLVASAVMMGRDATELVHRGPFLQQDVTGAGFESFELEGTLAGGFAQ